MPDVRDCYCLRSRRAARLLTEHYDRRMAASGVNVPQFMLLSAIGAMQPVAHQPLADVLDMDRTTLTRNLAVLEREGLVKVAKDREDARRSVIRLSAKGEKAQGAARPLWAAAHRETEKALRKAGIEAGSVGAVLEGLAALAK